MKYFLLIVLLSKGLMAAAGNIYPTDSIGLEKEKGKTYILHSVEENETLYSLSRRYNVSIYNIIENNPPVEFGLEIGKVIRIPFFKNEKKSTVPLAAGDQMHVVKPKETVFSISQRYNITIDELKRWNNLETNILDIGQELVIKAVIKKAEGPTKKEVDMISGRKVHVVQQGETLYYLSKKYNVSIDELLRWNKFTANEISIGQKLIVREKEEEREIEERKINVEVPERLIEEPVTSIDTATTTIRDTYTVGEMNAPTPETTFEEVIEGGNAEMIPGSENTRKYLALHRTAKIGTVLKVRNEMNGQKVFVRVMGKLPDTGINRNLLIKISKSAYDRLGAIDRMFRVSVSYIP